MNAYGIFGLRLQRPSFGYFHEQLSKLNPGCSTARECIEAVFGDVTYIHLTRSDKVDQAVSLLKAEQTGLWHISPDGTELERLSEPQLPTYDASAIKERVAELTDYDQGWIDWFREENIEPFRILYDELSTDPNGVLNQVIVHLGIEVGSAIDVKPKVAKLADRISIEWVERFRSEFESI